MPNGNFGPIKFGPGGQVLAENQELIAEIKNTPPLTPAILLKLVDFYQTYQPNRPLGNHLLFFVLLKLASLPEVKLVLDKAVTANIDWSDLFEDAGDWGSDENTEHVVKSVQIVHDGNVNLLTETVNFQGQELFFVIGVAPDLAGL